MPGVMWHASQWVQYVTKRNKLLRLAIAAVLIGSLATAKTAFGADPLFPGVEIVEFRSASYTYPPSPFKIKQSKKLGIPVEVRTEPSVPITGYLARPTGEKKRAAIVLLHTCAGISEHEEMWSKRLVSWGYIVLSVDSFKPRGFEYICDGRVGGGALTTPWRRALDAYGAKRYLSSRSFVEPDRIAVMGMSHGGMAVLETIKQSTSEGLAMQPFQAAVAFYPLCSEPEPINTPTLILIGSEDRWTPAELCIQYVEKLKPQQEITLGMFDNAHHAFDHPGIDTIDLGYIIRSNQKAANQANQMTREFLAKWLKFKVH